MYQNVLDFYHRQIINVRLVYVYLFKYNAQTIVGLYIEKSLYSKEGRMHMARVMCEPIIRSINYASLGQKLITYEQIKGN